MLCDDPDEVEVQVIQDVLAVVEARLREWEGWGWRVVVPRERVHAVVLQAVIRSVREGFGWRATLDRAGILDRILDGAEAAEEGGSPVDWVIRGHGAQTN
ncbi:hypothetical protein D7D52_07685 [Nocardia yunnanensis]|uniref:Uncharacterized protein n=1 Tax=Nocardia yunnanensis TaxID=2382165 RepID=A0A386ZB88_9NOCA|nr:hypothetical protein [Nocardia yunnanensis]AYF73759.1 hypothetical protein D7D52_07685 [Nocardia yunnanensis]